MLDLHLRIVKSGLLEIVSSCETFAVGSQACICTDDVISTPNQGVTAMICLWLTPDWIVIPSNRLATNLQPG